MWLRTGNTIPGHGPSLQRERHRRRAVGGYREARGASASRELDGSSAGEANDASGWKASVTWPVISCGYAAPGASVPLNCCAAVAVLDSPLKLADITVSVKAAEAVALVLSVT